MIDLASRSPLSGAKTGKKNFALNHNASVFNPGAKNGHQGGGATLQPPMPMPQHDANLVAPAFAAVHDCSSNEYGSTDVLMPPVRG